MLNYRINLIARITIVFLSTLLFLIGCNGQNNNNTLGQENIRAKQQSYGNSLPQDAPTYLVAVEAAYAPFAFRDEQGHVIGYDGDILGAIGEAEGFRVELMHQGWDGIFDTLTDKSRDIVASGVSLTDERLQTMDATKPVYKSQELFFVPTNSPFKSVSDLWGKKVASQVDTAMIKTLENKNITDRPNILKYPTLYLAFRAVMAGEADAVFGGESVLNHYINNLPEGYYPAGFKTLKYGDASDLNVFYVRKGRTDLLQKLNQGLEKIKANGEYAKINKKWFGKPDSFE